MHTFAFSGKECAVLAEELETQAAKADRKTAAELLTVSSLCRTASKITIITDPNKSNPVAAIVKSVATTGSVPSMALAWNR